LIGAGEEPAVTNLDEELAKAAERGIAALSTAWKAFKPRQQHLLKAALERRHRPRAAEVDAGVGESRP
jgi:hypothetical protein